jgi:hypothetical protein
MATTVNLRKIVDRKLWEMCSPSPIITSAGVLISEAEQHCKSTLYLVGTTTHYIYSPEEDGFVIIPSGALAGTFGAGACAASTTSGPSGTATAGTSTTLTTNLTIARDLRGYKIHITGGPCAGDIVTILSNTVGANAVITATFSGTITNASTYRLLTPRWYVLCAGTLAANIFKYFDFALNTWTALTQTGLPATISTDSKLIATPSMSGGEFTSFASGTATAGGASTLTNGAKTWTVNQWTSFQIRITAGTGLGQFRTIASNTATVITTSAAWTTNPDATSVYAIEGCDDFLYYTGSAGTAVARYNITANTWTSMAARTAPGAGMSGEWIDGVTDSLWTAENAIINGRRIYSFRGSAGAVLDYYDIPSNTWTSAVAYSPATEIFTTGTKYTYDGKNSIYIQRDATGRWFRFDINKSAMVGWCTMPYTQGTAVVGDTCFVVKYVDGATELTYIYMVLNGSTVMLRCLVI